VLHNLEFLCEIFNDKETSLGFGDGSEENVITIDVPESMMGKKVKEVFHHCIKLRDPYLIIGVVTKKYSRPTEVYPTEENERSPDIFDGDQRDKEKVGVSPARDKINRDMRIKEKLEFQNISSQPTPKADVTGQNGMVNGDIDPSKQPINGNPVGMSQNSAEISELNSSEKKLPRDIKLNPLQMPVQNKSINGVTSAQNGQNGLNSDEIDQNGENQEAQSPLHPGLLRDQQSMIGNDSFML